MSNSKESEMKNMGIFMNIFKRAAALALTAALVVGMTLPAFADTWYIDDGDISISAGENGNKVTQGSTTKDLLIKVKSQNKKIR